LFGGSSLFGNRPAAPALGASASQQPGALGSSLFGNTNMSMNNALTQQQAPPPLIASVAQPISAPLPIFNMLPPGPRAFFLDEPKKKVSLYELPPHRPTGPFVRFMNTSHTNSGGRSRLRGFSSPPVANLTIPRGRIEGGPLDLNRVAAAPPPPEITDVGGRPSSALGSGGRKSVRKLVLDRRVDPSEFFNKTIGPGKGFLGSPSKVTFSPQLMIAAREREAIKHGNIPRQEVAPQPANNAVSAKDTQQTQLQHGEYYTKPSLKELRDKSFNELSHFENLVVGRAGYGEIQFLDEVDLTHLPKLKYLLGDVIRFDDKECSVYADHPTIDKPPPGEGLNVKARIELVGCWALDKATREPIKDPAHPAAVKHLKRLERMKDTHFERFDIEEGRWVFTVDSF